MGNVRSKPRQWKRKHFSGTYSFCKKDGKLLKIQKDKNGYCHVDFHTENGTKRCLIHRLVAENFINNPNNYKYINHIDNNPSNNNVNNLEWCTQSYNIKYAYDNGNKIPPHTKIVLQIDLNTKEIINCYSSISEAHRMTGFNNIGACCRGVRNKAGGYKWQFA